MPGKKVECSSCSKIMRSDNLKRHTKICLEAKCYAPFSPKALACRKRPSIISGSGKSEVLRAKNPKILALLDEVVNDRTLEKSHTAGTTTPPPENILTKITPKVIAAEVFPPAISEKSLPIVAEVFPQVAPPIASARTKRDIIGCSNEDGDSSDGSTDGAMDHSNDKSSDEDCSDSEESIASNDDTDVDLEIEEFILPDTVEGIRNRFNELYVEFVRKKKHENRNELEFLLDGMLKQGAIDPAEYTQLNTRLTEKEDLTTDKEEKEEEEEEEEEENISNTAIQYLILHDKDELQDLIEDIKDEIDPEFMDIVLDIEKLLEEFFVTEFVDGESIRPQINALLNQLNSSKIPKSKQHRIKMLLDGIEKNRYRVQSIVRRLTDAENEQNQKAILTQLAREHLLSPEQFEQLAELEDPDLHTIKEVITDTKVGEGLKFLPRTIRNLRYTLQSLLTELKESGSALLKSEIAAIIEELLRRNAIRVGEYENLKELTI